MAMLHLRAARLGRAHSGAGAGIRIAREAASYPLDRDRSSCPSKDLAGGLGSGRVGWKADHGLLDPDR
jgi:hypothetical protein